MIPGDNPLVENSFSAWSSLFVRIFLSKKICQLEGAPETPWLSPRNYEDLLQAATPHRADITSIDENSGRAFLYQRHERQSKGVMLHDQKYLPSCAERCLGFNIENGAVELHTFHSSTRMAGVSHISLRYLGEARHDAALRDQRSLPSH